MSKKYILFDLDGTIVDSSEGIINSVAYSLKKFGIEEDPESLYKFIGPPLRDSFREFYNMNDEDSEKAVDYYREIYSENQIFNVKMYDGISDMMKELKARGLKIVLATSKPTVYAEEILNHIGIDQYFTMIAGSEFNGLRDKKSDVIKHVIERLDIEDVSEVLMVGDRYYDIKGAKDLGIDSIAVLYGFGNIDEFEEYGAENIVSTVKELEEKIIEIAE